MGNGKCLTMEERVKINCLSEAGLSTKAIAKKICRSRCVVSNYLKNKENYGKNYATRNNQKLSERAKTQIFNSATKPGASSTGICAELQLNVTPRHVRRLLSQNPNLKWSKMATSPKLTARHLAARLEYAKNYMAMGDKWKKVIFSDEKKFNLDGPDGLHYYWRDLRSEPREILSRNFGGGSLMVWAAFSYHGKSKIVFVNGRQTSNDYRLTLENYLLPFAWSTYGLDYVFQQDNARIHVSKLMKSWFSEQNIELLDHPACSPISTQLRTNRGY